MNSNVLLVHGYRFVTLKKNKSASKCTQLKHVFSKTSKKQIFAIVLQYYAKIRFKRLYNEFFRNIFQADLIQTSK